MWPNPQFPAHLVTFTEEICNEKLHFLCTVYWKLILHRYFSRNFPRFWVIAYNVFEFQGCLLHKCRKTTTWNNFRRTSTFVEQVSISTFNKQNQRIFYTLFRATKTKSPSQEGHTTWWRQKQSSKGML